MSAAGRIRVLVLVLVHEWWWREALTRVLERRQEFEPAVAANIDAARRLVAQRRPDVAIVDIDQPEGVDLAAELGELDIPCLALGSELSSTNLTIALSTAASFVVKQGLELEQLLQLLAILRAGDALMLRATRRALHDMTQRDQSAASRYGLTPREIEVLAHVAEGRTNVEIAEALHLAPSSVKKLVSRSLGRLGVRNRTEAAILVRRERLAEPDPSAANGREAVGLARESTPASRRR